MRDVAKKSGFSITTVSFVLNNKTVSIPQQTKDKIYEAVRELRYRPNQLAVSLTTKKTKVLGLIIPDNSNLFFAELSKAIEITAREEGYSLIYGNSNNNPKTDLEYMHVFTDHQVDGIIFTKSTSPPLEEDEESLAFISKSATPIIAVDRMIPGSNVPSVMLNHLKGGQLATRHLIESGHRRIGCFTGPLELASSMERLKGYRSALAEAGIEYDDTLLFEGNYQLGREEEALEYLLQRGVSAIFSFNDIMAFGLYREAQRRHLSIPRDISIVGFDDIPFCSILLPGLTTIRQPIADMGKCAVKVLLDRINGAEQPNENHLFEPQLILRESVRPV